MAGRHRQIGRRRQDKPALPRRPTAAKALIVTGDAEALAAAMPRAHVQDGRDEEHPPVVKRYRVGGAEDGQRNDEDVQRHAAPEAAPRDRVVGRAQVNLGQQQIGEVELTVAMPHKR